MKAVTRPETNKAPCPGAKKIALGDLKKSSMWFHLNIKRGTIPVCMHGMGGSSGKTLPRPEIVEVVGTEILVASNSNKKVGPYWEAGLINIFPVHKHFTR